MCQVEAEMWALSVWGWKRVGGSVWVGCGHRKCKAQSLTIGAGRGQKQEESHKEWNP